MFYLITNTKTKLFKLITGWDYSPTQIEAIIEFYKNHESFDVDKLA